MNDAGLSINRIQARRLCSACVGERYLRAEIKRMGHADTCFYCTQNGKTFSIGELAERIEAAFEDYYQLTPTEPDDVEYALAKHGASGWERGGDPAQEVIGSAAEIAEAPAADIHSVLEERHYDQRKEEAGEESPFAKESQYAQKGVDDVELMSSWLDFEKGLKTEARYFSRSAQACLDVIFQDVLKLQTRKGTSTIVEAGPGRKLSVLYRARVFQSEGKLKEAMRRPDRELGPPPSLHATAGRMNARGISVFYGATLPQTALSEVRPPVGSRVVIARFEIVRALRLLDVSALQAISVKGSIFDPRHIKALERAKFLSTLSARIAQPVMPDDEPFEYLATQAIADYLATELKLDGIIYPSVQIGKKASNVVLFHHAAVVEKLTLPENTKAAAFVNSFDAEEANTEYGVLVTTSQNSSLDEGSDAPPFSPDIDVEDWEEAGLREVTLRVDADGMSVHRLTGVRFSTMAFDVERYYGPVAVPEHPVAGGGRGE